MKVPRVLFALKGATCVAGVAYAITCVIYGEKIAGGFAVGDVAARQVIITFIATAAVLVTPRSRGLRLLWLLAGAWWIWCVVEPGVPTADGPGSVALLFRFQIWSATTLPLFVVTLAHWAARGPNRPGWRSTVPLLGAWAAAFAVCMRYDWINSDLLWPGVNYTLASVLCLLFLGAPPLLVVRWILRRDREVYPEQAAAEQALWTRLTPLLGSRWSAVLLGIAAAAAGFVAIGLYHGSLDWYPDWMVPICALLAGPPFGLALRRRIATGPAPRLSAAT